MANFPQSEVTKERLPGRGDDRNRVSTLDRSNSHVSRGDATGVFENQHNGSESRPSIRSTRLKCIPCNAPMIRTSPGNYVCVSCDESRVERRKDRTTRIEQDGVRLAKTASFVNDRYGEIEYHIEASRDEEVVVSIRESLPPSVADSEIIVDPPGEATHWQRGDSWMAFSRRIGADESIEIRLFVSLPTVPQDTLTMQPRIETVQGSEAKEAIVEPTDQSSPDAVVDGIDPRGSMDRPAVARNQPQSEREHHGDARSGGTSSPEEYRRNRAGSGDPFEAVSDSSNEPLASPAGDRSEEAMGRVVAAIPAYNEEPTIADVVSQTRTFTDAVIVVDDGSVDDTADRAAEAGAIVVEHERNRGYGAALQTAFREADRRAVDYLIVLDGDGQHDPTAIPDLLEGQLSTGAELVIGSRFADGVKIDLPRYRRLGLRVINFLANFSMGVIRPRSYIRDTQSGFRLYSQRAIEALAQESRIANRMDASLDILFFAHEHDFLIHEVGVTIDYSVDDPSSHNPIVHGYQLFRNLLRTIERERPLLSLGVPGIAASAFGVGVLSITLQEYLQTGEFAVGIATFAMVGLVIGLFACFTAIVLHALNTYFHA